MKVFIFIFLIFNSVEMLYSLGDSVIVVILVIR